MGQEKRKQKRHTSNLFIELELPNGEIIGRGVVVDVSLSGFAIDSEADLAIKDELHCFIEIPLKFRANVVRRLIHGQMKHYGLKFIGPSFLDKLMLKKILSGKLQTKKLRT